MCVTTKSYIIFIRDTFTVCVITGSNPDNTCLLTGSNITEYTYTCNPTTKTYTVTIPGSYMIESMHRMAWECGNPFGEERSNIKKLYVNGELFLFIILITINDS